MFRQMILFTAIFDALVSGKVPSFRILAPEFICPKEQGTQNSTLDYTVITIQTSAGVDLNFSWTVSWTPLEAPSQRFTLMLWQAIRALEKKLNGPQLEPYVYIIENKELLHGVEYIFNVTPLSSDEEIGDMKSFRIDNLQGDQKLLIDKRSDLFSIVLLGTQATYADIDYILEAQITMCHPTQDYYFLWTVGTLEIDKILNITDIKGSRLEIPKYFLTAGLAYDVNCRMIRYSNKEIMAQASLHFQVLRGGLEVFLSVDELVITVNQEFTIESLVINHDYLGDVMYEWSCSFNMEKCEFLDDIHSKILSFPVGLPNLGRYKIGIKISTIDKSSIASANAIVIVVENILPVVQINPISRIVNEDSVVYLIVNVSNVVPSCTLAWYFATEEYLQSTPSINETCDQCQHGIILTDTITVYSLEENFLNELTDYTNETEWRQVTADFAATAGRARFVAQCGCSVAFNCDTQGIIHADIRLHLNESPKPGNLLISPESGVALETVFRISIPAVVDPDTPISYSFFSRFGNKSILLASYMEHQAVETVLPYIGGDTEVWAEVCDARGACSRSSAKMVQVSSSERTVEQLLDDFRAYIRRCELTFLQKLAVVAAVTYDNAQYSETVSMITKALKKLLPSNDEDHCIKNNYEQYSAFTLWLSTI